MAKRRGFNRWPGAMVFTLIFGLAVGGCSSSDSNGDLQVNVTAAAMRALPMIASGSGIPRWGGALAIAEVISDQNITQFFKLECHMPGQDDNCPSGVTADDTTKYTSTTLIGLIYHAEMYMQEVFRTGYETCTVGEGAGPITVSNSSFVSSDGGDGSKYMIDFYRLLGCVGHGTVPATSYFTYSTAADKFAVIDARKHDLATAGWDQSDIWQVYLSQNAAGEPHLLAFNSVNINDAENDYTGRAVLLVNLETRQFLVLYRKHSSNYLVAAGKGGISAAGAYETGYYFVKTENTPSGICIDNSTRWEVNAANCAAETVSWSSAAEVSSYLGLTDTEAGDLANYLTFFTAGPTAGGLTADQAPAVVGDAINIPDLIQ